MFHVTHQQNTVRKIFCKKMIKLDISNNHKIVYVIICARLKFIVFFYPIETCIFIVYNTKDNFFENKLLNFYTHEKI